MIKEKCNECLLFQPSIFEMGDTFSVTVQNETNTDIGVQLRYASKVKANMIVKAGKNAEATGLYGLPHDLLVTHNNTISYMYINAIERPTIRVYQANEQSYELHNITTGKLNRQPYARPS